MTVISWCLNLNLNLNPNLNPNDKQNVDSVNRDTSVVEMRSSDKITINPFLDGSMGSFDLYKISNVLESEAERIVTRLFGDKNELNVESGNKRLTRISISTDGSSLSSKMDTSIVAEYVSEDITLWYLPISIDYDPRYLWQTLIRIDIKAGTLIIHPSISSTMRTARASHCGVPAPLERSWASPAQCFAEAGDKVIRRTYAKSLTSYFTLLNDEYNRVVPKSIICSVGNLRPKYQDLGKWLSDPNNLYISSSKPVYDRSKGIEKGEKFVKKDSPFHMRGNESNAEYILRIKAYIRSSSNNMSESDAFYDLFKSKCLGCWNEDKHDKLIIEEFRRLFIAKHFSF
jgi:hypothetical protein